MMGGMGGMGGWAHGGWSPRRWPPRRRWLPAGMAMAKADAGQAPTSRGDERGHLRRRATAAQQVAGRPARRPHQLRRHGLLGRRARRRPADGTAEVEFPLPESLTTWKVKTWTLGPGTRVGQGEAEIITTKDLLVRLQAPRFFVQKDEVVLSANVHNKLKTKKSVQVVLELEGSVLEPLGSAVADRRDRRRAASTASTGGSRSPTRVRPSSA